VEVQLAMVAARARVIAVLITGLIMGDGDLLLVV
jgi:hypothetical protein